jgi:hypothetical protein
MNIRSLTLALLSVVALTVSAQDAAYLVDGIYYSINADNRKTVYVVSSPDGNEQHYTGNVVIPETVEIKGKSYKVTGIASAFMDSFLLKEITIPSSVIEICLYILQLSVA